jgi:Tol biopolymer transport system component
VASGDITQITHGVGNCVQPDWLDADTLVYASDRAGNYDIVEIAADGAGEPKPLITDTVDEKKPAVSPDGRLIAYSAGSALAG